MKLIFIFPFLLLLFSCEKPAEKKEDYNRGLVGLVVQHADGQSTQIYLPFDDEKKVTQKNIKYEKAIFAEILKEKGFKIINREFNFDQKKPDCNRLIFRLKKEKCECKVIKKYVSTKLLDVYRISESISCNKILK